MRSMTAFGRAVGTPEGYEITVELKSVNNRFLDWSIRLPRAWSAMEERLKAALGEAGITRGKVDVTVTVRDTRASDENGATLLEPDLNTAARYADAARAIAEATGLENDLTVSRLITLPGIMVPVKDTSDALSEDGMWSLLAPVAAQAAGHFMAARTREGERLSEDLIGKLSGIRRMVGTIADKSEENIRSYHEKFEERLRALIGESGAAVDESRIVTECAVYADRVAIDEELVRLGSHFDALEELFRSAEPVGRRIDFMLQETNREVNTIGSKCSDAAMAQTVADVKSELEKIREQIQNIE